MRELELWSSDGKFGLRVGAAQTSALLNACAAAGANETGGVLVGFYSERHYCAIVTLVSGAAADSRSGRTWFHRGTGGVQDLLDRFWRRRTGFYLGEWHFHPHAAPVPSHLDHRSMEGIARSPLYNCPEPVLLILGGDPRGLWSVSAVVFQRDAEPIELIEDRDALKVRFAD
jgi:integrative and conjugative element protein (TIGR02256 family)